MFEALKDYWNKPAKPKPFDTYLWPLEHCQALWSIRLMPVSPGEEMAPIEIADGRHGSYRPSLKQAEAFQELMEAKQTHDKEMERLANHVYLMCLVKENLEK